MPIPETSPAARRAQRVAGLYILASRRLATASLDLGIGSWADRSDPLLEAMALRN